MTDARERILARVRVALEGREPTEHPGSFPGGEGTDDPADLFEARFRENGGEVVRLPSAKDASEWLASFSRGFESAAVETTVPAELAPALPSADAESAGLGVSMAGGAAADTASILLEARGGRRAQLLPPVHLIWVREQAVAATLEELLERVADEASGLDASALALHSGPSKSADIGQHLVKGVHGPGRVVAALLG